MAFEILARLGVNATGFLIGFRRAESAAVQAGKNIEGSIKRAFGIAAIISFERSILQTFGKIADGAERLRISIAGFQQFENILRDAGMESGALDPVIFNLEKAAESAASGKKEFKDLADIFSQLGIDASSFSMLGPEQQLRAFSSALQSFSEKDQASILREVLGQKVGPKMIGVLGGIAAGKGGENISPDSIVLEYENAGNRIGKAWDGLKKSIARDSIILRGLNRAVRDSFLVSLFAGKDESRQPAPPPPPERKVFKRPEEEIAEKVKEQLKDKAIEIKAPERFQQDLSALQRIGEQITGGGGNNIQRDQLMELREIKRGVKELNSGATVFP